MNAVNVVNVMNAVNVVNAVNAGNVAGAVQGKDVSFDTFVRNVPLS